MRAIRAVKPGREVNVIGRVIESYAKRFGYGVVRDFTGHGIGPAFHSGLVIPHYDDPAYDTVIEKGMTFTIEPMLTLGSVEWDMWDDGWTVDDAGPVAHGAVRAHAAGDRRRRGDPDAGLTWSAQEGLDQERYDDADTGAEDRRGQEDVVPGEQADRSADQDSEPCAHRVRVGRRRLGRVVFTHGPKRIPRHRLL